MQKHVAIGCGDVTDVLVLGKSVGNFPTSLNLLKLDKRIASLAQCLRYGVSSLSLTLGSDDGSLTLLLGFFNDELCAFSVLLGNLLLFDSRGEFLAKSHVSDRNIFKKDVKFFGSVQKVISDPSRNNLSICDQFRGIKLSDSGLQHFVTNGGKDSLIVVKTQRLIDLGKMLDIRSRHNT